MTNPYRLTYVWTETRHGSYTALLYFPPILLFPATLQWFGNKNISILHFQWKKIPSVKERINAHQRNDLKQTTHMNVVCSVDTASGACQVLDGGYGRCFLLSEVTLRETGPSGSMAYSALAWQTGLTCSTGAPCQAARIAPIPGSQGESQARGQPCKVSRRIISPLDNPPGAILAVLALGLLCVPRYLYRTLWLCG